jgi:N-acetylmuramoyl-L-alanine amidase
VRRWLWRLGIVGMLLLWSATTGKADSGPVLTLDGKPVDAEVRVVVKDGAKFINLPFLNKFLHINSDWDPDNGEIFIRFGKLSILMFEDQCGYTTNKEPRKLATAPFERDNQLWLPLEFIQRLGLKIQNQTDRRLDLEWDKKYLLGMEVVKYQDRPAFVLIGTETLEPKSFLLVEPDRMVVDLPGVAVHSAFDPSVAENNTIVKQVRFNQRDEGLRLVFDLNRLCGYQIIPDPDNPRRVMIVLNYLVEEVSFFQRDSERKVHIKSNFPARYQVTTYEQPNRLVLDLEGATLAGGSEPVSGDGVWISKIRMSQFNPNTVRVVLDLAQKSPCFVTRSRTNPNWIEIRTVQNVTGLEWSDEPDGGRLIISGDGELVENVRKLKDPDRLQIDLNFARFAKELAGPAVHSEQVRGIKLSSVSPTMARLEVGLNYYIGYTTRFSEDRRRLEIRFQRSPIIGKTLVLDPGHGGVDAGACGRQGTREKDINLEVSMRLKDLLEEAGAKVVLTRTGDYFISLYERPYLANYLFADLFVSVHTNNHQNYNVQGIEVYHYQGDQESKALAKSVLDELVRSTQLSSLGVKVNDFVVIREAQMPSILAELGFLSNFQEETTIKTPEFKDKAAAGLFQGIINYYQKP